MPSTRSNKMLDIESWPSLDEVVRLNLSPHQRVIFDTLPPASDLYFQEHQGTPALYLGLRNTGEAGKHTHVYALLINGQNPKSPSVVYRERLPTDPKNPDEVQVYYQRTASSLLASESKLERPFCWLGYDQRSLDERNNIGHMLRAVVLYYCAARGMVSVDWVGSWKDFGMAMELISKSGWYQSWMDGAESDQGRLNEISRLVLLPDEDSVEDLVDAGGY